MSTIAEMIAKGIEPYAKAIAVFSMRNIDRAENTVTFTFQDQSKITFKIKHEVLNYEPR